MNFSPGIAYFLVWAFEMSVETVLVYLVWRQRKRYPKFLSYISFHLIWSLSMFPLAMSNHPIPYFYCWWWGRALLVLLECATVGAVLGRILKPLLSISIRLTSVAVLVGSLLCGCGWAMSSAIKNKPLLPITKLVLSAERGLTTIEAVAILFCIGIMSVFAFRWSRPDAFVTAGFVFQALCVMISDALLSFLPIRTTGLIQNGLQVTDLITFGLWIAAFYPISQYGSQCRVRIKSRSVR